MVEKFPPIQNSKKYVPAQINNDGQTSTHASLRNCILRSEFCPCTLNVFKNWYNNIKIKEYDSYYTEELLYDSLQSYIDSFSSSQKEEYQEAYDNYIEKRMYDSIRFNGDKEFNNKMVVLCKSHVKTDEIVNTDYKFRNITAQNSFGKILMGWIVGEATNINKKLFYGFDCGKNFKQLGASHTESINMFPDPVCIDIDGSGFDATQYGEIKEITDTQRYKILADRICAADDTLRREDVYLVLEEMHQVVSNHKSAISYTVYGTVGSGYMSTSDANTERTRVYIEYGMRNSKIPYRIHALGDDCRIYCDRKDAEEICKILREEVYVDEGECGKLGQIAKKMMINNVEDGEYLSTQIFRDEHDSYKFIRLLNRVIIQSPYTYNNPYEKEIKVTRYNQDLNLDCYYNIEAWSYGLKVFDDFEP